MYRFVKCYKMFLIKRDLRNLVNFVLFWILQRGYMKINGVYYSNVSKMAFTAGNVFLYSDFDGTFFPLRHSQLHKISENDAEGLRRYFQNFGLFLENKKNNITFKITTGRTFGEFKTIAELIKSKGIKMPLPDALIVKNGSDEYIKIGSDENYYQSGVFPFNYNKTNLRKEESIKNLTGWQGKAFRQKIIETLKQYDFKIIEHDSEHCVKDYGHGSLFAHINYDNFNLDSYNMKPRSEWAAALRNDGNLKFYLSFPYDMLNVEERRTAYNNIKSKLSVYLASKNVKYVMTERRDESCNNRPVIILEPEIREKALDKLYDTREAVKKAYHNNDFVIAAGDGMNDLDMLNPLNYIDTKGMSADLKNADKLLENSEIVKQLENLPFTGIVIKDKNNGLEQLFKLFGKFGKIIEVERGKLQEGIEDAIKMLSRNNSDKTVLELDKSNKYFKSAAFLFLLLFAGGTIFLHNKKQKSKSV